MGNVIIRWEDTKAAPFLYEFYLDGKEYKIEDSTDKIIPLEKGKHQFYIDTFWLKSKIHEFEMQSNDVKIDIHSNVEFKNKAFLILFFISLLIGSFLERLIIIAFSLSFIFFFLLKFYMKYRGEKFVKVILKPEATI